MTFSRRLTENDNSYGIWRMDQIMFCSCIIEEGGSVIQAVAQSMYKRIWARKTFLHSDVHKI